MKKLLFLLTLAFPVTQLWSQDAGEKPKEDRNFRMPLIGEVAPSFVAESTLGTVTFPDDYGRKWKILFSHPQDFTPVCTSEILDLANIQSEFDRLGVKLVVVSADPVREHIQWEKAMEDIKYQGREPVKIKFPLVDDENLSISKKYGMIHPATNSTRSVRGVFIVDQDNIIQAIYFYPFNVGRSTDELLRMVTALQTASSEHVLTPSNWKAGNDVLVPFNPRDPLRPETLQADFYDLAWFMWYKKAK